MVKKYCRYLWLVLGVLMMPFMQDALAAENLHNTQPYSQYAETLITFGGDGLTEEKKLTVGELEKMSEGYFTGTYTMRTLVEPHDEIYTGIDLYWLLNNKLGLKPTAKAVRVICADGVSMEFSLDEVKKADYVNETDGGRLKFILAFAKKDVPLVPDAASPGFKKDTGNVGGPLRLVVGQVKEGERNSPKWLQNVTTVKVSTSVPGVEFSDLGNFYSWAKEAISSLAEKGIVNGVGNGKFAPEGKVTRAELAKMLILAEGLTPENSPMGVFTDAAKSSWYTPYVEAAARAGLIEGVGNNRFNPTANINRNEMAALAIRAMGYENEAKAFSGTIETLNDEARIPAWAKGYVAIAEEKGIFSNIAVSFFNGTKEVNRAEAAVIIYRALQN